MVFAEVCALIRCFGGCLCWLDAHILLRSALSETRLICGHRAPPRHKPLGRDRTNPHIRVANPAQSRKRHLLRADPNQFPKSSDQLTKKRLLNPDIWLIRLVDWSVHYTTRTPNQDDHAIKAPVIQSWTCVIQTQDWFEMAISYRAFLLLCVELSTITLVISTQKCGGHWWVLVGRNVYWFVRVILCGQTSKLSESRRVPLTLNIDDLEIRLSLVDGS